MTKLQIHIMLAAFMLLANSGVLAQNDTIRRKSIGNDSVVVINSFVPIISDGVKLSYPPKELEFKKEKSTLTYSVPVELTPIAYPPISIKPLAINKEKPIDYPGSYLKLGFGTQFSPLAELYYTDRKLSGDLEKMDYGVYFKHLSAYGSKIKNQNFMDNNASVFVNYYPSKALKIGTRLNFENHNVFYYGYSHTDTSFAKSDVKQSLNYLNLDVNLANAAPNKLGIDHETHIIGQGQFDKYNEHDGGADIYTDLKKTFLQKHEVSVHLEDYYTNFSNKITSTNNNLFNLKPTYQYNGGSWKVHGGFGITMDNGTFRPSPDLGAQWAVVHDYIIVYGGWNLEVRKMTFHDLTLRNPWIEDNTFQLLNTRFEDRFAGLKGAIKGFSYDLQFSQKVMREMPLFINDSLDVKKRFLLVYNLGTLKYFDLRWNLQYIVNSNLDFAFHGDFNVYDPEFELKAWHLPTTVATLTVRYRLAQKIFLKADIVGIGKSYAKLAGGQVVTNGGTADINLGATYKFSKYFSFFAELNNLANIKYQQYYAYPTYGFNGKLGVILTYQK